MAILIINRSESKCGECGNSAFPSENSHITMGGWSGNKPGCGAVWNGVTSDYIKLPQEFTEWHHGYRNLIGLTVYDCGKEIGLFGGQTRENATMPRVSALENITLLEAEDLRDMSGESNNSESKGLPKQFFYVKIVASNGNKLKYGRKGGGKYTKRADAEWQVKSLREQGFDARLYETPTQWSEVKVD